MAYRKLSCTKRCIFTTMEIWRMKRAESGQFIARKKGELKPKYARKPNCNCRAEFHLLLLLILYPISTKRPLTPKRWWRLLFAEVDTEIFPLSLSKLFCGLLLVFSGLIFFLTFFLEAKMARLCGPRNLRWVISNAWYHSADNFWSLISPEFFGFFSNSRKVQLGISNLAT